MKNKLQPVLWLTLLLGLLLFERVSSTAVKATIGTKPAPKAAPKPPAPELPLNQMRIGQCDLPNLNDLIAEERKRGLLLDARPFSVNQTTGKMSFSGSTGRVSIVHMNPFAYNYSIAVTQKELVTTAINDFIKLLLPPTLGAAVGLQSGSDTMTGLRDAQNKDKLTQIGKRLDDMKPRECTSSADPANNKPAACLAIGAMYETFDSIRRADLIQGRGTDYTEITSSTIRRGGNFVNANREFTSYAADLSRLRDVEADAPTTCNNGTTLNVTLGSYDFPGYFNKLEKAQQAISDLVTQVSDLERLIALFKADTELTAMKPIIRCKGYNCIDLFDDFTKAVRELLGKYQIELDALRETADKMRKMYQLTEQMKTKEGLFTRTFVIIKKFELSQATVSLNREVINEKSVQISRGPQSGTPGLTTDSTQPPQPVISGGTSSEGTAPVNPLVNNLAPSGNQAGTPTTDTLPPDKGKGTANVAAATSQVNEVVQIGRPRFMLSGGVVFSPLPRRTFQSVKGFVLDAQGNPTGTGNANVIGFGENSSRRILPMVLLNSRLLGSDSTSLFFSVGVSAKHDANVDIEYLFGPSVSVLNDRALFTFGLYGGMTQNLVNDVKVGDELPDSLGNATLYRKGYTWKPGFSFSYAFSRPPKENAAGGGSGGGGAASSSANELKNEIRIGSIPFNLAVGFAYTSLEQRTYDEIVGFARDRQGNLTDGQKLARIVGLNSSSNYRLTPLALLHSRLTNFGSHDLYFSTGVTGKKTDNSFDVEYLLGGSVNLYRRRVFVTFGTFAGKQQILGGDFFEGAKLSTGQNVTTQNRYVWKPAIAISYDISKIIPRN